MMEIPQLNTCCGCISLRTGTKIIGWLCLVSGIVALISLISMLIFIIHVEDDPHTKEDAKEHLHVAKVVTLTSLLVIFLQTVFNFVLLLGVYQGKSKLVYCWVVARSIIAVLNIIFFTTFIIFAIDVQSWTYLLGCAFDIYFILVVYSYYREIQNSPTYSA